MNYYEEQAEKMVEAIEELKKYDLIPGSRLYICRQSLIAAANRYRIDKENQNDRDRQR